MITVKAKGLDKAIQNLKTTNKQMEATLWRLVQWGTIAYEREVKRLFSGKVIKVRSGKTRASITHKFNRSRLLGITGGTSKNLPVLEHGGPDGGYVTAKKSRLLTIPFPGGPAVTASGVPRGTAREIGAQYESSFWKKSKKGNMILFGTRSGELIPLFIGKERVKIEAKKPFWLAQKIIEPEIHKKAINDIDKMLSKVNG